MDLTYSQAMMSLTNYGQQVLDHLNLLQWQDSTNPREVDLYPWQGPLTQTLIWLTPSISSSGSKVCSSSSSSSSTSSNPQCMVSNSVVLSSSSSSSLGEHPTSSSPPLSSLTKVASHQEEQTVRTTRWVAASVNSAT